MANGGMPAQPAGEGSISNSNAPALPAPWRRILLPFDGSAASRRALGEAMVLARERGATLEVFGVFDPAAHVSGFEPSRLLVNELLPRARERALADLEEAARTARAAGVDCDALLVDGDLSALPQAIVRRAAQLRADLVVMGTHGRMGVDRILQGSVAEQLLRRANVPVLLVRMDDRRG